mgnify:CR=1 FL=1
MMAFIIVTVQISLEIRTVLNSNHQNVDGNVIGAIESMKMVYAPNIKSISTYISESF